MARLAQISVPGAGTYDTNIQLKSFGAAIATSLRPDCFPYRGALGIIQYGGYWYDEAVREAMIFIRGWYIEQCPPSWEPAHFTTTRTMISRTDGRSPIGVTSLLSLSN